MVSAIMVVIVAVVAAVVVILVVLVATAFVEQHQKYAVFTPQHICMEFHVVKLCALKFVDVFQFWLKLDKNKSVCVTTYLLACVKFLSLTVFEINKGERMLQRCVVGYVRSSDL